MSEFIDVISPSALADIEAVNAKIVKTIELSKEANKNLIGAKSPSSSDSAIKSLNAELLKSQKLYADLQIKLERFAQAQAQTVIKNNQVEKSTIALNKAREQSIKQAERQEAKEAILANVYNKTQRQLNLVTAEYNNLSAKKERYNNLTAFEEKRLVTLTNVTNKYQTTLKGIDSAVGKYSRNVGNYAQAWSPLGNAIGQISRELPNFAISARIGIMSLTNNIGALQDAVAGIRAQNAQLKADGKETQSVMKQIGAQIMSFNTALYLGIALFTAYGDEIIKWTQSLFGASEAMEALTANQKLLNNARLDSAKNTVKDKEELRAWLMIARDAKLGDDERRIAVDKVRGSYAGYFKQLTDVEILEGKTAKAFNKTAEAIDMRNRANLIQTIINENKAKLIGLENDLRTLKATENYLVYNRKKGAIINEMNGLINQNNQWSKEALNLTKNSILLDYKETTAKEEKAKAIKKVVTEKKKEADLIEGSVQWLEREISTLKDEQSRLSTTTEQYQKYEAEIKTLTGSLDILIGKQKELKTVLEEVGVSLSDSDLLGDGLEKWSKDQMDTFRKNTFGAFDDSTENWKEQFQDWAQVALDAINTVQQAQQQANERELYNLEKQRDTAILFAGESADARAEVDRQYDEKRRALLNRQAKQDKALAITQAIINTAGAVIAGLKTSIPYAIAVGVIGAAQIALIASQQIPQFYKGTDNAPEGLAWTQEKGAELITDKKGNIKSYGSNKGAQMTYLNKGDKVFTAKETKDIMFNNELNGILTNNGISNSIVNNNVDLSPLRSDINNLTQVIKNKSEVTFVRDIQGERVYKREQGQKKVLVSNRLRIKP